MTTRMPAISLAAVAGRRAATIEAAAEAERLGFSGIYGPSMGDCVALCQAIAMATNEISFGTTIHPIYLRHPSDLASTAAFIHEIGEGRFKLGIGVTHGPVHDRLGVTPGKPLSDTRGYVAAMRKTTAYGDLPPIVLATLRNKMLDLAVEIGDGAVWANASLNHFPTSVERIGEDRLADGFFVANMIPTVIDPDREAGAARNRATLQGYVRLPNYRNYWREAGYGDEMDAIETALAARDDEAVTAAMSDAWLSSATLYGSAQQVRDGVEAWFDAGCSTPILVPSSTGGGQMKAIAEMFACFGDG
ncbi:MAG: LLM class flavin-dependent oxidoreductase [Acidimicrobiales bacterium]|nr:LLM class flavin-dependent oxidoreductase [Acidimicrobiales bacterium]